MQTVATYCITYNAFLFNLRLSILLVVSISIAIEVTYSQLISKLIRITMSISEAYVRRSILELSVTSQLIFSSVPRALSLYKLHSLKSTSPAIILLIPTVILFEQVN